ncbi:MAG: hypothetical protein OHK93_008424 [Ramalina farinacea]|uniref:Uncharacterized protein n=1 Tax=Ramalina farinacea TaxID=258253 RepID=A0AA43QQA9_9LECA|nr:hypothetical protein [Ramalina farinacea]
MSRPPIYDPFASPLDDSDDDQPLLALFRMWEQQERDERTNKLQSNNMLDESAKARHTVAVNTTDETTGFRLLDLPAENRRQILGLVLPHTVIDRWWGPLWEHGNTALLRTCQQLHTEATSILYSTNTFVIQISLHRCPQFIKRPPRCEEDRSFSILSTFRQQDLQLIRKIELEVTGFDVDVGLGKYNIMNMGGLALGLQEEARRLVQALSQQQCSTVKVVKMVWTSRDAQTDMRQHRKTVMLALQEAGVRIEEFPMRSVGSDGRT